MNDAELFSLVSSEPLLFLVKGIILLLVGCGVTFLLRSASAGKRHLAWNLTFVALLGLAIGSIGLPRTEIGLRFTENGSAARGALSPAPDLTADADPALSAEPSPAPVAFESEARPARAAGNTDATPSTAIRAEVGEWVVWAWFAGGCLVLLWFLAQFGLTSLYKRQGRLVDDPVWLAMVEDVRRQLAVRSRVQVLVHHSLAVPITWGLFRPVIVLPSDAEDWPADRRRVVLLHEMVHVQRFDYAMLLASHLACAIYWFNPLIWFARRRWILERERSCDDVVLASGISRSTYAQELLYAAEALCRRGERPLPLLAMGRGNELRTRITALLDSGQRRDAVSRRHTFVVAGITLLSTALLASVRPADSSESDVSGREAYAYATSFTDAELTSVSGVTVSPDGHHLYAAAWVAGRIGVFPRDEETGMLSKPVFFEDAVYLAGAVAVRLSPDGRLVAVPAFRSRTVSLYQRNSETGELTLLDRVRSGEEGIQSMPWPIEVVFAPKGEFLYVISAREIGSLSVFSISGQGELGWVQTITGQDGNFDNARGIALSPDGRTLYVTSPDAGALTVLDRDQRTGEVSIRQILRNGEDANGLAGAFGVDRSDDGRYVYVSSGRFNGETAVSAFAVKRNGTLQLVQELIGSQIGLDPFQGGNELMLSPDERHLFVTGTLSGTVAHFSRDAESGMIMPLDVLYQRTEGAAGLAMDESGGTLYVAAEEANAVTVFRRTSLPVSLGSASGLEQLRRTSSTRQMLDSTWTRLREIEMGDAERNRVQSEAASIAFETYLDVPETAAGRDFVFQAMKLWGNSGNSKAVRNALEQISPNSAAWQEMIGLAGIAFTRSN